MNWTSHHTTLCIFWKLGNYSVESYEYRLSFLLDACSFVCPCPCLPDALDWLPSLSTLSPPSSLSNRDTHLVDTTLASIRSCPVQGSRRQTYGAVCGSTLESCGFFRRREGFSDAKAMWPFIFSVGLWYRGNLSSMLTAGNKWCSNVQQQRGSTLPTWNLSRAICGTKRLV